MRNQSSHKALPRPKMAELSALNRRTTVHAQASKLSLLLYKTAGLAVYTVIASYIYTTTFAPDFASGVWSYFLVSMELVRLSVRPREDPLGTAMGTTFVLLFAIAGPGIYWLQGRDTTLYVAIMILFKDIFESLCRNSYKNTLQSKTNLDNYLSVSFFIIVALLVISLVSNTLVQGVLAKLGFIAPFAVALVYYERYLREGENSNLQCVLIFGIFLSVIAVYVSFFWLGFGRIRIGSFLLIPLLLLNFYRRIGVHVWQVVVAAPVLLYVAQASRYGGVTEAEQFFLGSAGVHITYTDDLWGGKTHETLGGMLAWIDQWLLLLANWFPSELWSSKPIGIGYSSVDDWRGRDGVSEGFSISLGFIGEQYYLLGEMYWIGIAANIMTLFALRRGIKALCRGYVVPLIMFDVNLMSYIWGGGATFGSRLFFFIVPTVLLIFLVDRVKVAPKRIKFRKPIRKRSYY